MQQYLRLIAVLLHAFHQSSSKISAKFKTFDVVPLCFFKTVMHKNGFSVHLCSRILQFAFLTLML